MNAGPKIVEETAVFWALWKKKEEVWVFKLFTE